MGYSIEVLYDCDNQDKSGFDTAAGEQLVKEFQNAKTFASFKPACDRVNALLDIHPGWAVVIVWRNYGEAGERAELVLEKKPPEYLKDDENDL